jgi:hypothetical protein
MAGQLLIALAIGYLHHPPSVAHAAVGSARVHRPVLVMPAVARIACVDRSESEQPAAAKQSTGGPAVRAVRVARWLRQKRLGIYIALASSVALGGTRPSFAAARSAVPPDLEQAFRREQFTPARLKELGVDVNKILTKKFLFAEHQMTEVQKEINDYESAIYDADSNRGTQLAIFMGVSAVGAKVALGGAKKIETCAPGARRARRAAAAPVQPHHLRPGSPRAPDRPSLPTLGRASRPLCALRADG